MKHYDIPFHLITGGAGFLGSHLTKRLLEQRHNVLVVDNLSSSDGTNIRKLLDEYPRDRLRFVRHDITYSLDSLEDVEDNDIVGIFNLACPASPPFYQKVPVQTMRTNVQGSINVLSLADQRKCKILQASTSEIYGDPEISPQTEDYRGRVNTFGPRACYDEGKRAAETLFHDFHKQHGTDIRVVRIFNTYGPNMLPNDGRVISNFIMQALNNEQLTVYGLGNQTRSFCYVDDLIEAMLTVWNSNYRLPVNIGNPEEYNMLELANKVIEITGSNSDIIHMELPIDDPLQRRPDIILAKSLGWKGPTIPLDTGLRNTIQYFSGIRSQV